VVDTAGALAKGLDVVCVWSPVAQSADCVPRQYGSAAAIYTQHGYCEGVEYAALHFARTGKPVLFQGLPIAVPGAIGRVDTTDLTAGGTAAVSLVGSSTLNEHDGVVEIITGGVVGTSQIVLGLSLDGGRTYRRVRLGTAASYTIPFEGVLLTFTGTLVAGDTISWHASAPRTDASGWALARAALAAQSKAFRSIVLCGDLVNDTEASALVDQINAYKMENERAVFARAGVLDRTPLAALSTAVHTKNGTSSVTFDDDVAAPCTITRSAGSWITDGFAVGDVVTTSSATNPGPYTVTGVTALVLSFGTGVLGADEDPSTTITVTGATGLAFVASTDVVTRSSGSWVADGFRAGDVVTVAGASSAGEYTVVGVTALALDLGDGLSDEVVAAGTCTIVAGQTKAAWLAACDAEFAPVDAQYRISLGAGRGRVTSPLTAWYFRRPVGWAASLREYAHDLQIAPWRKNDGPTGFDLNDAEGNLEEWDDRVDGAAACAARFTSFRTFANGPEGAFIAQSLTRAVESSLLSHTHHTAVVNLAENLVQQSTEDAAIGVSLILEADGTATPSSLSLIEDRVNKALHQGLLAPGREGPRASLATWAADASVLFNVPEPLLLGTLTLVLNGTVHSVATTIRVVSGG